MQLSLLIYNRTTPRQVGATSLERRKRARRIGENQILGVEENQRNVKNVNVIMILYMLILWLAGAMDSAKSK